MTDAKSLPEPEIIPPGENPKRSSDTFDTLAEDLKFMLKNPLSMPRTTYALYAIAAVTGVPMLIGLVLAYVVRSDAPAWLQTHYNFMIRTFWYGLALIAIGLLTFIIGVGMFLLWILPLWYVVRIVRGWMLLENQKPIPNPESWLFS
ncbi:MAG: hypothetical protein COB59_06165 [Rhodospirillaceae bacterium]|nr:MAG: hypothetical protein COB59_06165 [Rhodospirillaceae bacterium]